MENIKFTNSTLFYFQLENIGNFVRAITEYGLKPHDIFEANDLFENVNHTQVQSTLIALAGMVRAALHTFFQPAAVVFHVDCISDIYSSYVAQSSC